MGILIDIIPARARRYVYAFYAFIGLVLGALGYANMWLAIFADVGVMVLAVLNSIRALNVRNL